jgi:Leucine-rich repeat (LRR) protein
MNNDQVIFNLIKNIVDRENLLLNLNDKADDWYDIIDLAKPNGDIYEINIGGRGLRDIGNIISLLKELKSLTGLYIYGIDIKGIEHLKDLKNLRKLELECDYPFDISPIGEMKNLTSLMIHRIPLDSGEDEAMADISPLRDLTRLRKLTLILLGITDICPLGNLSELKELDISANYISDISSLKHLKKLEYLNINCNSDIVNISALRGLKNLIDIDADGDNIKNISVLKYLGNIKYLSMEDNRIKDISVLKNLRNLVSLNLSKNAINDISPLEGLNDLSELYLEDNCIQDFSPIRSIYFRKYYDVMIEYNPSVIPPAKLIKQGNEAVGQYFKQMLKAEKQMIRKVNKELLKNKGF